MQIDKLKTTGTFCHILLHDLHGEYPLPSVTYLQRIPLLDSNNLEDLFTYGGYNDQETFEMTTRIAKGICNRGYFNHVIDPGDIADNSGIIWQLQIQKDQSFPSNLIDFKWRFQDEIKKAAAVTGGDDDYYDYFPGFLDMFRQFSEIIGESEEFKAFVNNIVIPLVRVNDIEREVDHLPGYQNELIP
jgi:hypothetical protein